MRRRALVGGLAGLAALVAARGASAGLTDQLNEDWYTIAAAAKANNIDAVTIYLARGVNPNSADFDGRSALSYAAQLGNAEMAKLLLDAGAAPDIRDKLGNAPLHWAAESGRIPVMRLLIAAHAPVNTPNRRGATPLMLAAGRGNLQAVRLLLDNGADPRRQDFTGHDAAAWAVGQPAVVRALQDALAR